MVFEDLPRGHAASEVLPAASVVHDLSFIVPPQCSYKSIIPVREGDSREEPWLILNNW